MDLVAEKVAIPQDKYDYSLAVLRVMAIALVVLTHFGQYYAKGIGLWFYNGITCVNITMASSALLYSARDIKKPMKFYLNNFIKILTPYYIYISIMALLYIAFAPTYITLSDYIGSLFCVTTIRGLGHFWFLRAILLCYLFTPFLYLFTKHLRKFNSIIPIILTTILQRLLFYLHTKEIEIVFCYYGCYLTAYFIGVMFRNYSSINLNKVCIFFIIICIIVSIAYGTVAYNFVKQTPLAKEIFSTFKDFPSAYYKLTDAFCYFLGLTVFFVLYKLFGMINYNEIPTVKKILKVASDYSFYVFITHHIFIMGPEPFNFSHMNTNLFVRVTFLLSIICAIPLKKVSDKAEYWMIGKLKQGKIL